MDSLFPEYDPKPRPAAAQTVPMFEVPAGAAVAPRRDFGQAVAPVREVRTPALLDTALALPGEDCADELAFRFRIAD
ncbi:hypothetical protein [Lentzea terrae]|uniref:hypothetical protein n=1 Tax=Lentzea terrae TaxID=2200761 RepID=UPI001300195A|nr:hypothetical protein [Lentzea terrae]